MVGSIGIDGLISGMKTTELIDQLLAVEGNQQKLLASKRTGLQSVVSALQSLNTKVASLGTAATTALKAESWQTTTASSTSTSVVAVTSTDATPSSVTMTVDTLASSQSTLYTLPTSYSDAKPMFTLAIGGELKTITASSDHIGDIVSAFNAEGTGVSASAVNVGTAKDPVYKLQLTGTTTGATNSFSLTAINPNDGTALSAQSLRTAADAQITLWPGTPGETKVFSSSNEFKGVLTGVDLTVSKTGAEEVTVTVGRNAATMSKLAANIVTNLSAVLGDIADRTKSSTGTATDGGSILKGGLLSGNTAVRVMQQAALTAGALQVDGKSPASVGIVLGKDGTFTYDEAKFTAAYNADPVGTQKIVQAVASTLETAATSASDPTKGSLTAQIKSYEGEVSDLADRIADWDDRLTTRRASLTRTYTAMEVAMSKMQSTSNFLSQQLAQLNANNAS
ncbi:flagellar filament capping protein FliD [Cellulomonas sp. NPDC058312]|uniref:flagellar filament capping protein FliD n=1 Tax=Cellulomonas sp. NPDC058312 TaxID=3346441 RepID=UPI0036EB8744